jgi:predicted secreted Zn-dependent protease
MKSKIFVIAILLTTITATALAKAESIKHAISLSNTKNCIGCDFGGANQNRAQLDIAQNSSNPSVSVKTVYYQINGSTAKQLRTQMNQFGPLIKNENRRYDGMTNWFVRWSYRYSDTNGSCTINSVNVSTEVIFTLPKWNIPRNVSSSLIASWNKYLAALQVHENGHKNNGIAAGNEILRTLKTLPASSSCPLLEKTANSTSQSIIKRYNQEDIRYDRNTKHGLTQGTRFP